MTVLRARHGAVAAALLIFAPLVSGGAFRGEPTGGALGAQERPSGVTTDDQRPPGQLPEPLSVSPGGAFWRALVLPGWGHVAIGSHTRGAFYFGAQTATLYTFFRTRIRLGEARDRASLRETVIRQRLAAEGVTDLTEIEARLDADDSLGELRSLVDSREEQQEDMVALSLFFLLISGVDAYVSAHLARFPEPLELEARPAPNGSLDVGLKLRLGN